MLAVLRRGGFEAESVTNGFDAIRVLSVRPFSAIVLDLLLPRGSGYEVLEWLQNAYASLLPRVIILSATNPAVVQKHAVTRSVYRIMQKPFEIMTLLDVVRECAASFDPFAAVRAKSDQARADAGVVGVVDRGSDALQLVWSYGYPDETMAKYNALPLRTKAPLCTAVVEARPIWMHTRRELLAEFPLLETTSPLAALAAVPIVDHGTVTGSIGWRFTEEQPFDDGQQAFLLSIAADCLPLPKTIG